MPLTTKRVTVGRTPDAAQGNADATTTKTFVKMTREPWLVGAVTGRQSHGLLGRTTLLTTLRDFVEKACNGELDTRAVEEDADEYGPMQEIEVDDETRPRSRGGTPPPAKRTRSYKNHAKNRLLTVTVPAISPEEDPTSTETKTVQLYVVDRKQVWLDIDDVEWAPRFLYMQYALRGVPVVSPDSAGPGAPEIHPRATQSP